MKSTEKLKKLDQAWELQLQNLAIKHKFFFLSEVNKNIKNF